MIYLKTILVMVYLICAINVVLGYLDYLRNRSDRGKWVAIKSGVAIVLIVVVSFFLK